MVPFCSKPETRRTPGRKLRILLADQSPALRQKLKETLEQSGHAEVVAEAGRSTEALELFFQMKPELVIASICLPDQCGFEILRHVKRAASSCDVILTGRWPDSFVREAGLLLGATGVCPTSDGLVQLGGMVRSLTGQPLRKNVV